jgi:hypothetical protein
LRAPTSFTVSRLRGQREFLETPEPKQAAREIENLSGALFVLSPPFAGRELLTAPRKRRVLDQIVRDAPSKEQLVRSISPPWMIEFHRRHYAKTAVPGTTFIWCGSRLRTSSATKRATDVSFAI